jgi:hypothetical protein
MALGIADNTWFHVEYLKYYNGEFLPTSAMSSSAIDPRIDTRTVIKLTTKRGGV